MAAKEAKARIKINRLLEEAGWRFFDIDNGKKDNAKTKIKANVLLENNVKITVNAINELGEDFEKTKNGFIDFLLLDSDGYPFIVLEAKSEDKNPLFGKEQARRYAISQNCRFVILSNGNIHYFWDLERGNPNIISRFPSPETAVSYSNFKPNCKTLFNEHVADDYIALTQKHDYKLDPAFLNYHLDKSSLSNQVHLSSRTYQLDPSPINEQNYKSYIETNKLRFLRAYQLNAVKAIQAAVSKGKDRFLFEMATGTGKTLVSAAVIKLFLRTGNARRVLFLVDRIELEEQAHKAFTDLLKNDYKTVTYKKSRDDWRHGEIVVSTVQTLLAKNRYKRIFTPDDFDLLISDEAHRSIGGNSRAVFEYFIGYKLGLTATPKDYLKKIDTAKLGENDPRELERRLLLDSYKTFGCEDGEPTFRYSLLDGVKGGFLVNPIVVDARTEITTQLLSDKGYSITIQNQIDEEKNQEYGQKNQVDGETNQVEQKDEEAVEERFFQKDFEKRFFSDNTNQAFCRSFLENALRDPISGEIGKTIIFCVSQNHAAKITQILNEMADAMFPNRYNSDFAIQVTSRVDEAQQFTSNFTHNKLSGTGNFNPSYKTSKTRVCVTVGMMTTGYDCPDILNLCLMRPIFSPTDFIQIKGRGTRKHNFTQELADPQMKAQIGDRQKERYKIFDFFANCEYFEEKFNYDEILKLPKKCSEGLDSIKSEVREKLDTYESSIPDRITKIEESAIGLDGMKIDRMYFEKFERTVIEHPILQQQAEAGKWEELLDYVEKNILDKPEEYYTLEKLRSSVHVDRRISLREIIEKIFGLIPYFKSKDELLDEEFDKFDSRYLPKKEYFDYAKTVFKAYLLDIEFRHIVDKGNFALLNVTPYGEAFKRLPPELRKAIPEYIKDFVPFNKFAA
ncbi:MAG: DEAD/DEAH box helicase family protein [Desulfamplus sp.]|nr:DEAD/DEAH box helicase family protein [Desulfamplus sp.]